MTNKLYKNHTFRSEVGDYVLSLEKDVQERMRHCITIVLFQLKVSGSTTTLDVKSALRFLMPTKHWSQAFVSDCLHLVACRTKYIVYRDVDNSEGVVHRLYELNTTKENFDVEAARDELFKQLNL